MKVMLFAVEQLHNLFHRHQVKALAKIFRGIGGSLLKLRNNKAKSFRRAVNVQKNGIMMTNYRIRTRGSMSPYNTSARILMRMKKVAETSTEPITTG